MPGRVALVKDFELHAVKADKAVEGGYPEETVGRLIDAANDVLRQAVVGGPDVVPVLRPKLESRSRGRPGARPNENAVSTDEPCTMLSFAAR